MASVEDITSTIVYNKMQRAGVDTLKNTNIPAAEGERGVANKSWGGVGQRCIRKEWKNMAHKGQNDRVSRTQPEVLNATYMLLRIKEGLLDLDIGKL